MVRVERTQGNSVLSGVILARQAQLTDVDDPPLALGCFIEPACARTKTAQCGCEHAVSLTDCVVGCKGR